MRGHGESLLQFTLSVLLKSGEQNDERTIVFASKTYKQPWEIPCKNMDVQDKPHMHLEVVPDNVEWSDLLQPDVQGKSGDGFESRFTAGFLEPQPVD